MLNIYIGKDTEKLFRLPCNPTKWILISKVGCLDHKKCFTQPRWVMISPGPPATNDSPLKVNKLPIWKKVGKGWSAFGRTCLMFINHGNMLVHILQLLRQLIDSGFFKSILHSNPFINYSGHHNHLADPRAKYPAAGTAESKYIQNWAAAKRD